MLKISSHVSALSMPSCSKSLLYGCVIRIGLWPASKPAIAFCGLSSIHQCPGAQFFKCSSLSLPVAIQVHSVITLPNSISKLYLRRYPAYISSLWLVKHSKV